jgi:aspartyl-tRNA(Asn)/glutamyl-tRNA(Gln) amidotransferase subunit C
MARTRGERSGPHAIDCPGKHPKSTITRVENENPPGVARVSNISRDEVAHLARLARMAVTEEELDVFAGQLDQILDSVAKVSEVASDDVPPMSHAVPLTNTFRDDEVRPGLSQEQALAGAPAAEDGRFRVPRILGEEQ